MLYNIKILLYFQIYLFYIICVSSLNLRFILHFLYIEIINHFIVWQTHKQRQGVLKVILSISIECEILIKY